MFGAWLDPELSRGFLFATASGHIVEVDIDPRVGEPFRIVDNRPGEGEVVHEGRYLEIFRPHRLVFEFAVPQYDPRITEVALDVRPDGTGTHLTLTHNGVPAEWRDQTRDGWSKILDMLEGALRA